MFIINCLNCNKEVKLPDYYKGKRGKFCNSKCFSDFREKKAKERFYKNFIIKENGCWEWSKWEGCQFKIRGKRFVAQRYSYLIHKGKIPEKKVINKVCSNQKCVNPEHLKLVDPGFSSIGKKLSEEHKLKIKKSAKRGKDNFNYKRVFSLEQRKKLSVARKGKKAPWCSGDKNYFWKGGVTAEHKRIRTCVEYRLWREAVFERDNYTCIWCGAKSGNGKTVVLNADHIKPFSKFPELRLEIDNGRTLCVDCHKKTGTWGRSKKI